MTPAKLWLRIFLSGFVLIVGLLIVTLETPPFYGDMTRIGLLSETDFGWRIEPPHVDPKILGAVPVNEADVLVIGDSFSMTNRWQSALTVGGYRVTTAFWGNINEEFCDDFDEWLDRAGFHGKLVIVESVERLLNDRLAATQTCKTMSKPFTPVHMPFFEWPAAVPQPTLNWDGKLTSGVLVWRNTRNARKATEPILSNNRILVRPIPDGCALFSNRLCDKIPFWPADDENGELTPANAAQMKAFNEAHPRRHIMWMVIPNKTTVYVKPEHSKDFVTTLEQDQLGPDLFSFGLEQKGKIRDFFFPNDTHLSMFGQLALGQRMLEAVRKIFPPPSEKAS
jgi:hypothetical protein